jgi:hypothetical protein
VQFWSLGKQGEMGCEETCVSHDSHRVLEKGCVKRTGSVKSAGKGACDIGLRMRDPPQGAKVIQTLSEGRRSDGMVVDWGNSHRRLAEGEVPDPVRRTKRCVLERGNIFVSARLSLSRLGQRMRME